MQPLGIVVPQGTLQAAPESGVPVIPAGQVVTALQLTLVGEDQVPLLHVNFADPVYPEAEFVSTT